MINCVVGTAGHIDHGKTRLVQALTGIDTDRLEEEKRRGISIDLGFANLDVAPDVRCGFVDVPGHERFVKNMLAGVGGIDIVLLIIAADESIKPQTREHFDICRLLGIQRGIVVLTKADIADNDILELSRLEASEFVLGSFLEHAPIIAVSSVTGAGLQELKDAIATLARTLPARDLSLYPRLPIDRVFSLKGFGAVVTGTLIAGTVKVEDELEVQPLAKKVRVRGIQVHGAAATEATAGQRTALNIGGIEHQELARGMSLCAAGKFVTTKQVDCVLDLLPSSKPLKHRAPVHFHSGTAEVEAEVRLFGESSIQPGQRSYARLALSEPLLLLPGDRFILRRFSPVTTIAGGTILDAHSPFKLSAARERLTVFEQGTAAQIVALLVREFDYGCDVAELVRRTGRTADWLKAQLRDAGCVLIQDTHAVDPEWFQSARKRIETTLAAFHKAKPLLPGMTKEDLRSKEFPKSPPFLLDALLEGLKSVVADGDVLRLASHKLSLKGDEEQALAKIESAFATAGLSVPAASEVLKTCGVEAGRARSLLQILLREKRLIKVSEDLLFHPQSLQSLRSLLSERKGTRFGVPEFKDWTGVSRKYAIPLLEYFDRERVTRREGDARLVL